MEIITGVERRRSGSGRAEAKQYEWPNVDLSIHKGSPDGYGFFDWALRATPSKYTAPVDMRAIGADVMMDGMEN